MSLKFNFKLAALCAIIDAMLVMPALGQVKGEAGAHYKEQKAQMIKELKLAPEKEKAMLAVEAKYAAERQGIIAGVKKARVDLQAAVVAAKPGRGKAKGIGQRPDRRPG